MSAGALTVEELRASVASILRCQAADGLILWHEGGHTDPWNHVEAAMALDVAGHPERAELAYRWLVDNQRADGSWHQYYTATGVEDAKFDANTIAYVAVGVLHHWHTTQDRRWLGEVWPMIEAALGFVLELQQPTGEVLWAREPDGTPFHYALLAGSSSIHRSLGAAIEIGSVLGAGTGELAAARDRLAEAIVHHEPEFFAEKDRWAMDWYYPVLGGVIRGSQARGRLESGWDRFVMDMGVRCVDDHPWVTTGETAEAAMACWMAGMVEAAAVLLGACGRLRAADGSYFTGLHVPTGTWFPAEERTTYSTAAVLLADALLRAEPATVAAFA